MGASFVVARAKVSLQLPLHYVLVKQSLMDKCNRIQGFLELVMVEEHEESNPWGLKTTCRIPASLPLSAVPLLVVAFASQDVQCRGYHLLQDCGQAGGLL